MTLIPDGPGILYAIAVMGLLILAGEWLVMQGRK